jgi:hydroxymethylbilane synthase
MKKIRIGTRGSRLALYQSELVAAKLRAAHPDIEVELVVINTSGEWKPEQGEVRLTPDKGGKALFAKEIEAAILDGYVDCGVHSLKDMPAILPEGLVIEHVLEREDVRDVLLTNGVSSIEELPQGAVVGTASLRRQAFIKMLRPDLEVVTFRGNVPTRIEKLRATQVDATILAMAGLKRLALEHEIAQIIPVDDMLPAAGQGAIGIEIRANDDEMRQYLEPLNHYESNICVTAERAALEALGGGCHTPVGSYATLADGVMTLVVRLVEADGSASYDIDGSFEVTNLEDARDLGLSCGAALRDMAPDHLLEAMA